MDYTFATVIIADADKSAAQADFTPETFTAGLSETGQAPATHWTSSGPWDNADLDKVANVVTWPKRIYFGQDAFAAFAEAGLQLVQEPPAE